MNLKERSWAFYDWANSAHTIIIVTAVFPLYFKNSATLAGIDAATSTAYLGYANSIGSLIVSLLAPLLGTIADFKGYKKRFFMFFVGLGVLFTLLLAIIPVSQWFVLLFLELLDLLLRQYNDLQIRFLTIIPSLSR